MSSEIKSNKISPATGTAFTLGDSGDTFTVPSGTTLDIASGATLDTTGATVSGLTTGKVLQVVQANKSNIFSTSGTTFVDVTDLSLSIIPSSTSSKILVMFTGMLSGDTYASTKVNLLRDSTILGEGSTGTQKASITNYATGSQTYNSGLNWLDSPSSTSSLTYKVQLATDNTTGVVVYLNRNSGDANYTGSSSLTVMEIAG
mgnify:CR=1 FL=1|tara:strand:- start:162 stop:767 length:606 start_codon:yes stop_codon:yes gene_type:complete